MRFQDQSPKKSPQKGEKTSNGIERRAAASLSPRKTKEIEFYSGSPSKSKTKLQSFVSEAERDPIHEYLNTVNEPSQTSDIEHKVENESLRFMLDNRMNEEAEILKSSRIAESRALKAEKRQE